MNCPSCGHLNPTQAKFCLECGARLALQCSTCGAQLPAGAKFCLECGAAVAAALHPAAAPGAVDGSPGPIPSPPAAPPESSTFANGRYAVKRFLGEGGKKRVYLAHDTLLDRDVAFALIKAEGLDDLGRERVRR